MPTSRLLHSRSEPGTLSAGSQTTTLHWTILHYIQVAVFSVYPCSQRSLFDLNLFRQCSGAASARPFHCVVKIVLLTATTCLSLCLCAGHAHMRFWDVGLRCTHWPHSSVWIMGVHILHNHRYGIDRHTNQGQPVLSERAHRPHPLSRPRGQPRCSQEVASSIKSLGGKGRGMLNKSGASPTFKR